MRAASSQPSPLMKIRFLTVMLIVGLPPITVILGCSRKSAESPPASKTAKHEHTPPHGGTPVVLGAEAYHLELVRDASAGKLQAFVFDGELENFIRCSVPSFQVVAIVGGQPQTIVFRAVANT